MSIESIFDVFFKLENLENFKPIIPFVSRSICFCWLIYLQNYYYYYYLRVLDSTSTTKKRCLLTTEKGTGTNLWKAFVYEEKRYVTGLLQRSTLA